MFISGSQGSISPNGTPNGLLDAQPTLMKLFQWVRDINHAVRYAMSSHIGKQDDSSSKDSLFGATRQFR